MTRHLQPHEKTKTRQARDLTPAKPWVRWAALVLVAIVVLAFGGALAAAVLL